MAVEEQFDPSTIYYIYSGESEKAEWEENIYEAIDAPIASPPLYDEIVEYSTNSKCLINCSNKSRRAWPTCIPLWMRLCIPLFIFVASVGYLSLSGIKTTTVAKTNSTKCTLENGYFRSDWYVEESNPSAHCVYTWDKIQVVKIQQLQVIGETCDDRDSCLKLIRTYESIAGATSNYSYYVDGESTVYGGRGWYCPYTAGELWVAVLVNIFPSDHGSAIADKILMHFTYDIIPCGQQWRFVCEDYHVVYVDNIVVRQKGGNG